MVIAIVLALLVRSESANSQEVFSFQGQSSYVDETKILHLLGEVKNNSDEAAKNTIVSASFHDQDGNLLGEFRRSTELTLINPGESSPFEILYLNQENVDAIANFTLSAVATPSLEVKEEKLKIVSSNSRLDILGTLYINSQIRNEGNQTSTNTIMIATLYDKSDKVIAIGRALAEAVRGTADVPSDSEAAFGIVVTEKLQTYKVTKYSLSVQSNQYISDLVVFRPSSVGQSSSSGNQTQSGCLIATAAFGSEYAPEVQQLREFRDDVAMNTLAGSSFMRGFNAWYYSFSPSIAEYERGSPWAREVVRALIVPLLGILGIATSVHSFLSSGGFDNEVAIIATGMAASSLIGMFYLFPVAVFVGFKKKGVLGSSRIRTILILSWTASAAMVGAAALGNFSEPMILGTSMLVLCSMSTALLFISDRISRLKSA